MFKIVLQFLILIPLLASPNLLRGQADIEVEAGLLGAFNAKQTEIWGRTVHSDPSLGMYAKTGFSWYFEELKLQAAVLAGYHFLELNGEGEDLTYSGTTHRISFSTGLRYWLVKEWGLGTFLDIENNRDLEEWRTSTNDLLRYSLSVNVLYRLHASLKLVAGYRAPFYPMNEAYFLYNPAQQVWVGLNYGFL